ncbi:hypothetical protein C8J36_1073 [Rhizobium sp. PP-F2F-G48]|nr:hypothetical protein C8J36_1073 [Rhizobium sp. PP-F2F-G48]
MLLNHITQDHLAFGQRLLRPDAFLDCVFDIAHLIKVSSERMILKTVLMVAQALHPLVLSTLKCNLHWQDLHKEFGPALRKNLDIRLPDDAVEEPPSRWDTIESVPPSVS